MSSMKLLREYIKTLLEKKTLSPNTLKTMSLRDVYKFATKNYVELGTGSSRTAYAINPRKVLKIAKNSKGLAQNQEEAELYQKSSNKFLFAKTFDHAPDFSWLVSELVRPLNNKIEFNTLSGVNYDTYMKILEASDDVGELGLMIKSVPLGFIRMGAKFRHLSNLEYIEELNDNPFLHAIVDTIQQHELGRGDLILSHFGKTADGRIALLDYGFTWKVADNHYDEDRGKNKTDDLLAEPAEDNVDWKEPPSDEPVVTPEINNQTPRMNA